MSLDKDIKQDANILWTTLLGVITGNDRAFNKAARDCYLDRATPN